MLVLSTQATASAGVVIANQSISDVVSSLHTKTAAPSYSE
jgi:hypothetical protein